MVDVLQSQPNKFLRLKCLAFGIVKNVRARSGLVERGQIVFAVGEGVPFGRRMLPEKCDSVPRNPLPQ
ncbi:hypothetical protein MA16_Dca029195 [Dendrobium catenatum]|uniref:Uncharacterized protein n=1 Tax=Dendrobium catenatum TaxID=906689 RepID=A0A2I0VHS2_9ASPA|nr:hypothetical protein MA16_Dca029195 [Dendrobium catenatum]